MVIARSENDPAGTEPGLQVHSGPLSLVLFVRSIRPYPLALPGDATGYISAGTIPLSMNCKSLEMHSLFMLVRCS